MLSDQAGFTARGFFEAPAAPSVRPLCGHDATAGREFAALAKTALGSRFFSWQGRSGKSYVVSVYPALDCPAFCEAVLLAVAHDDRGGRRIVAAFATGAFPEPVLSRAARAFAASIETLDFHVNLMGTTPGERRMILADLEVARRK